MDWGPVAGAATAMIPGGQPFAPLVGGAVSAMTNKVQGVPTPTGGSADGQNYSEFMDKAYPGTTPWERLGASAGSYPGSEQSTRSQQTMQEREFKQQNSITDKNNRASIISSTAPLGQKGMDAAIGKYSGAMTPMGSREEHDYETQVSVAAKRLAAEMPGIGADNARKLADSRISGTEADFRKEVLETGINADKVRPMMQIIDGALKTAGMVGGLYMMGKAGMGKSLASSAARKYIGRKSMYNLG